MTCIATDVLTNNEIQSLIHSYQNGIYECLIHRFAHLKTINTKIICVLDLKPYIMYKISNGKEMSSVNLCLHSSQEDPRFILHLAIMESDIEAVKSLLKCRKELFTKEATDCACRHGSRPLVEFLYPIVGCTRNAIVHAAEGGHSWVIDYLLQLPIQWKSPRAIDMAAKNGHLFIIQLLYKHGLWCTNKAMNEACRWRHFEVVKFLHEYGLIRKCTTDAMDFASQGGHLGIVQYLDLYRHEGCTHRAMDWAAANGHFDVVKYLHENRIEGCTTYAMDTAAENGHFKILKYLHENRIEGCTTSAIDYACREGHLEIVKYLIENRIEGFTIQAIENSIEKNNIKILKILLNLNHGIKYSKIIQKKIKKILK